MSAETKTTEYRCLHEDPLEEIDPSMSNLDHEIDDGVVEGLADGQHMANYSGWEFHAYVYYTENLYVADVHRYRKHVDFITAATLEDLMDEVCDEWGSGLNFSFSLKVIDRKTSMPPSTSWYEVPEWAHHLLDFRGGFALDEEGLLLAMDNCGNYAYVPLDEVDWIVEPSFGFKGAGCTNETC